MEQGDETQGNSGQGEAQSNERSHDEGPHNDGERRRSPHRDSHRSNGGRFGDRGGRRGPPRRDSRPRGDRPDRNDGPPPEPVILEKLSDKIIVPGDEVGTTEEFTSGDLTYEKDGKIYAAVLGTAMIDRKNMTVSVKAMNPPNVLKQGDIVIGMIRDLREKMAMVTVMKVHGNTRAIAGDTDATIQISQISKNYTESIRDEFRTGDFVRAKVVSTSPSLQLSTVDDDLGVIRAVCSNCKGPMVKNEKGLYCEDCDKTATRKTSSNYGDVFV